MFSPGMFLRGRRGEVKLIPEKMNETLFINPEKMNELPSRRSENKNESEGTNRNHCRFVHLLTVVQFSFCNACSIIKRNDCLPQGGEVWQSDTEAWGVPPRIVSIHSENCPTPHKSHLNN